MSLWNERDNLYIEANIINVQGSHFYHYYPGYSKFSKILHLDMEIYVLDDTNKNNIKFNYTIKDIV